MEFFLHIARWVPLFAKIGAMLFLWLIFAKNRFKIASWFSYQSVALMVIAARFTYAVFTTIMQYYTWSLNAFSQVFLNVPVDSSLPFGSEVNWFSQFFFHRQLGYFMYYCLGRIWYEAGLSIVVAILFLVFLRIVLDKYRSSSWFAETYWCGFASSLIVGWPAVIIFVPLGFFVAILHGLSLRFVFKKSSDGNLVSAFIIALTLTVFAGQWLINWFGLKVLVI